jgi:type I restriction enzyme S subunit
MSTATLHSEKKETLLPKLRFSEFDGKWKNRSMRDFTKINQGLQIPISERFYEKSDDNYFYITNEFLRKDSAKSYFIKNPSASVICYEDDILMTRTGNTGQVVTGVHGAFHNNFFKIKYDETCDKWFLYFFLTSRKTQHTILKLAGTSTIPDLNHGDFYKITLNIPTLPEQQKIATFLSAVDEKIQQLSRKKELLEQYKKGVMQQLFSGKLRFKDENGKDYADWEEKNFGDIFSFYTTNSLSRENLNYDDGEIKNIHYGDIHTKFKTLFDINNELVPFINSDFNVSKIKTECYCQEGDLVIADASEDYADIGKSIEIVNIQKEKIVAGLHTFLARPNKTKMYVGFSGYIVRSDNFRKQIMTIAQGSKVLSISTGRLAMVKMKIPCVQEQQKIADFLSSIDVKIESTNQQINQTQSFKKGLLQQLFV